MLQSLHFLRRCSHKGWNVLSLLCLLLLQLDSHLGWTASDCWTLPCCPLSFSAPKLWKKRKLARKAFVISLRSAERTRKREIVLNPILLVEKALCTSWCKRLFLHWCKHAGRRGNNLPDQSNDANLVIWRWSLGWGLCVPPASVSRKGLYMCISCSGFPHKQRQLWSLGHAYMHPDSCHKWTATNPFDLAHSTKSAFGQLFALPKSQTETTFTPEWHSGADVSTLHKQSPTHPSEICLWQKQSQNASYRSTKTGEAVRKRRISSHFVEPETTQNAGQGKAKTLATENTCRMTSLLRVFLACKYDANLFRVLFSGRNSMNSDHCHCGPGPLIRPGHFLLQVKQNKES